LFFYNGLVDCETYYIESGSINQYGISIAQNAFPYFDNYNVVSGSFPTETSRTLLFNNEAPSYGTAPTASLYTEYWEDYISLLYNPKTRLLNCSAIIPLADYVKMELNDVVNFRGNYYHLRAINDYSLKDGTCNLQLLGPIISDTLSGPPPPPPPPGFVSWSYSEISQDGTFTVTNNGTPIATLTANGSGSSQIDASNTIVASLAPVNFPSSGSVTMSLNVNGGTTLSVSSSTNTTISSSFIVNTGQTYNITGSIRYNAPPPAQISWSFNEGANTTASFTIYESSSILTTLTSSASGNATSSGGKIIRVELGPVSASYILGTTMSINVNDGTTIAVSGSTNTTISASFTASVGNTYYITGSSNYNINYASGAKVIFDFGNPSSYSGTGTTVTNLGSGGSAMNATLVNTPTYLTTNGGVMSFASASQEYMQFDTALSASFTTMAIVKHNGSSTSWGTNASVYNGFPNIRGNNGFILTNNNSNDTLVLAILWNGASTIVPAANYVYPSNIAVFNSYAYSSNGTNEHKMYLNSGSAATATNSITRGNSATITSYICRDVPNNGYLNGEVMAYLQYDRVLTADEIKQNYDIFARRF
jgi:hypothetical protein